MGQSIKCYEKWVYHGQFKLPKFDGMQEKKEKKNTKSNLEVFPHWLSSEKKLGQWKKCIKKWAMAILDFVWMECKKSQKKCEILNLECMKMRQKNKSMTF